MKASKIKFLEKVMKETPNEIDLHGYFVPEAVEITAAHIDNLVKEARNGKFRVIYSQSSSYDTLSAGQIDYRATCDNRQRT